MEGHWGEKASKGKTEEEETETVQSSPVVDGSLKETRTSNGVLAGNDLLSVVGRRGKRKCTEFLGSTVTDQEDNDGRGDEHWDNDAEHSVSPSPAVLDPSRIQAVCVDAVGDIASDEGVEDEGEGDGSLDSASPFERGDVGNDEAVQVVDTGVTERVDDLTGSDGLDVVGSGGHRVADGVERDRHSQGNRSREDVGDLMSEKVACSHVRRELITLVTHLSDEGLSNTAHDGGDDRDETDKRVSAKSRSCEGGV